MFQCEHISKGRIDMKFEQGGVFGMTWSTLRPCLFVRASKEIDFVLVLKKILFGFKKIVPANSM